MNTCDYCGNNVVAYTECLTCGAHKSKPLSHTVRYFESELICQSPRHSTVINQLSALKELYEVDSMRDLYSKNPFLGLK